MYKIYFLVSIIYIVLHLKLYKLNLKILLLVIHFSTTLMHDENKSVDSPSFHYLFADFEVFSQKKERASLISKANIAF